MNTLTILSTGVLVSFIPNRQFINREVVGDGLIFQIPRSHAISLRIPQAGHYFESLKFNFNLFPTLTHSAYVK